ncbi:hypothetical protein TNCT_591491 [Trichonephila clavata]|uniref:Uncharacterized protein n=1 Tax=Trichonephila clavata TaxID=2740835 RepID=A0A8X6LW30_TRICU|nr:hypothetical protein TNCT_591491 [Trichonephila clavata]
MCLRICENGKVLLNQSELDLFTTSPIQMVIDRSSFVEIHPVALISDNNSIEFLISVSDTLSAATTGYTEDLEHHKAVSYSIIATDADDKLIFHEFSAGENAIANFFETLKYLSDNLMRKCLDYASRPSSR